MTTETILTDEQIGDLYQDWRCFFKDNPGSAALCIRAIEQAVLQSEQVQAWKRDAECMRAALQRIAAMNSMSYQSLDSAKITANAALENTAWPKKQR